jgi:hypothetical protein
MSGERTAVVGKNRLIKIEPADVAADGSGLPLGTVETSGGQFDDPGSSLFPLYRELKGTWWKIARQKVTFNLESIPVNCPSILPWRKTLHATRDRSPMSVVLKRGGVDCETAISRGTRPSSPDFGSDRIC